MKQSRLDHPAAYYSSNLYNTKKLPVTVGFFVSLALTKEYMLDMEKYIS